MPEYNDRTQTFISKDDFFIQDMLKGLAMPLKNKYILMNHYIGRMEIIFFIQSLYKELIILQNHI